MGCKNLMKFNKRECKVLNLGRNNSVHWYRRGPTGWKAGPCGPKVLTDKELNIASNALLWVGWPKVCIKNTAARMSRQVMLSCIKH